VRGLSGGGAGLHDAALAGGGVAVEGVLNAAPAALRRLCGGPITVWRRRS
jgi:hypothetical protein